jgi:hypothetical protein
MDLELELYGDSKEKTSSNAIGKVYIVSLSSQPVDHEDSTEGGQKVSNISNNFQQYVENFKEMISEWYFFN